MIHPLQITWRDVPKSEALEAEIRAKAEKLDAFYEKVMSCFVTVERSGARHHKGNLFRIRIDIRVPDKEIVVTRDPSENHAHEDVYVTVRDAFDAARRQLQDYARIRRGQVKQHDLHHAAKVLRVFPERDFGILGTPDGREVYFHRNALQNANFDSLAVGTEVAYVEELLDEGPQAKRVSVGKHHA